MKNLLSKVYHILILFVIPLTFVIATAETCDGFEVGGGSGSDSGGDDLYIGTKYPETHSVKLLTPPQFRYDLSKYAMSSIVDGTELIWDFNELMDYQNVYTSVGFLDFYTLFDKTDNFSGEKASLKFIFTEPRCKGNLYVTYGKFNDQLCNYNTIEGCPKITKVHVVEIKANSIKTTYNGLQIKWKQKINVVDDSSMIIENDGKLDDTRHITSHVKVRGFKNRGLASARLGKDGKYVLIDNTVSPELESGEYSYTVVPEKPLVSDVLDKKVCVGGRLDTSVQWKTPETVKLSKLESL